VRAARRGKGTSMFIRKYIIPVLAVAGVGLAIYTARASNRPITPAKPVAEPARSPFPSFVAGAGIVEASTQNIAIGTPLPGIATSIPVKVGDRVKAGEVLFTIDDRAAKAEVASRSAQLAAAEQTLARLESQPRPEELPGAEARVLEAEAELADAKSQADMWEGVTDKRAVSTEDLNKRRYAAAAAEARLRQARAELSLLKAGAWKPDIEVARAQVQSARAQLDAARTDLDRLTVRAPIDCTVLQVNLRVGEFAPAGPSSTPLMLVGDLDTLHVRTDVDENDAWRLKPGAKARGSLRGNSQIMFEMTFVRIDPYVIPKRSLTGDAAERVDTRVLQVIYAFRPGSDPETRLPVYAGQQVDVFIEAPPRSAGAAPVQKEAP
jgi:HlyD family secretion protein